MRAAIAFPHKAKIEGFFVSSLRYPNIAKIGGAWAFFVAFWLTILLY
jgi:hypothetical protein